jgi:hypothetical protein
MIQIMDPMIQIMDPKFWERLSVTVTQLRKIVVAEFLLLISRTTF